MGWVILSEFAEWGILGPFRAGSIPAIYGKRLIMPILRLRSIWRAVGLTPERKERA